MTETLLSFLASFAIAALREWLRDRKRISDAQQAGAEEAARKTEVLVAEKEHAQIKNDTIDRGGAAGVAERLRRNLGRE